MRKKILETSLTSSEMVLLRTKYLKFPVPPKAKEVNFEVMSDVYPSHDFLCKRFNMDLDVCRFCKKEIETTIHLFRNCFLTQSFWFAVKNWLAISGPALTADEILYGSLRGSFDDVFLLNVIIILGKIFIHKSR